MKGFKYPTTVEFKSASVL